MYLIKTICVCGAGTMGSGIAQLAAIAGYHTIQFDLNPEMLIRSRALIEKNLSWLTGKGKISETQKAEYLQRIVFTSELSDCVADLVIEAIIEKKQAKTELFNQLAAINTSQTIFATNTSSISVTELADGISHPDRLAGMHFFNPAPVMKLVEIITTAQTDPEAGKTLYEMAGKMGKTAVFCKDAPGFIVNRVARTYYLEAMKLVSEGVTSVETVDAVLEATGFKMGPFRLMDLIGMDINYSVSQIVWDALGKPERLTPSPLQKAKVETGKLGRKTGEGFYVYEV